MVYTEFAPNVLTFQDGFYLGVQAYREKDAEFSAKQAEYQAVTAERDEVRRAQLAALHLAYAALVIKDQAAL